MQSAFISSVGSSSLRSARKLAITPHPVSLPTSSTCRRSARISTVQPAHLTGTSRITVSMVSEDATKGNGSSSSVDGSSGMFGLSSQTMNTLYIGFLFFLWYAFNIIFNIMNKKILNAWSNPWTLSTIQLFIGSIMALLRWLIIKSSRPNVSLKLIKALFLPTLSHLVGHVSTCISFSYVAVSFSHIVKACEPAFGAFGSALVLKEIYSPGVYLTLLPIIFGVALSAVTQIQFSWPGFLFAMLSNVAFASRNIFSKLTMGDFKNDKTLTAENLYGIMSIYSLFILTPFALLIEQLPMIPSQSFAYLLGYSGIFYTLYNTVSFMALGKTGVVTHAVGNILKRASVIVVSILVFKNPVKLLNGVGMTIALIGTFLYSIVKQRFLAKKKAQQQLKQSS